MEQDAVTTVCDKCGKYISHGIYGFSHPCSGYIREINEQFKKAITFASSQEEIRQAHETRAYANIMYNPSNELKNLKRGESNA